MAIQEDKLEVFKRARWVSEMRAFMSEKRSDDRPQMRLKTVARGGKLVAIIDRSNGERRCSRCGFVNGHADDCFVEYIPISYVKNRSVVLTNETGRGAFEQRARTITEEAGIAKDGKRLFQTTGNDGEQSELGGEEDIPDAVRDFLFGIQA